MKMPKEVVAGYPQYKNDYVSAQATGRVEAIYSIDVMARVPGFLIKKYFKEGDFVKKGQTLFQIDPREYQIEVRDSQASVNQYRALLLNAQQELNRANSLIKEDLISHSQVDSSLASRNENQALLDAAENATLAKADSNYMRDAAGNPILLFERTSCEEFDSTHNMNAEDPTDSHTWFSALNICVNKDLLQYPTHLGLVKDDGSVDYETAATFRDAFTKAKYVLNPTLSNQISIQDYYSNFMAQIANSGNVYQSLKKNQELTVNQIEGTRQGSIGVSTDEELSNMIKFQNAYNASSRFINVIDECTEHIITQLGS